MLTNMVATVDDLEPDEEARAPRKYTRPQLPDDFRIVTLTPIERCRLLEHENEALTAQVEDLEKNLTYALQRADHEQRRADCFEGAARAVHRAAFRVTR